MEVTAEALGPPTGQSANGSDLEPVRLEVVETLPGEHGVVRLVRLVRSIGTARTEQRSRHVLRVVEQAMRLAGIHGIDPEAAKMAALGHDILRAHADERLLTIAQEQGHVIDAVDRLEPILMHGPLAVPILREQYGVVDADVLGAVAAVYLF